MAVTTLKPPRTIVRRLIDPALRRRIAEAVEQLIVALDDTEDTDSDTQCDDDPIDDEPEPSLGSVDNAQNQSGWSAGGVEDMEGEHDGREPEVDDEPSLGSPDNIQTRATGPWAGPCARAGIWIARRTNARTVATTSPRWPRASRLPRIRGSTAFAIRTVRRSHPSRRATRNCARGSGRHEHERQRYRVDRVLRDHRAVQTGDSQVSRRHHGVVPRRWTSLRCRSGQRVRPANDPNRTAGAVLRLNINAGMGSPPAPPAGFLLGLLHLEIFGRLLAAV